MATLEELWAPTPERRAEQARRQTAMHDWHMEWSARQLDAGVDGPVPDGRKDGSDYNQHVPDLEADGEALDEYHTRARQIMGLPPL